MSEETRAALQEALGGHVAARRDMAAAGLNPAYADRAAVITAAAAHLEASPPKTELEAAYTALRDDPAADPAAVSEAAHALAGRVQAERVQAGLPVESGATPGA